MDDSVVSMYYSANFGFVRPSLVERHGVKLDKTKTEVHALRKLIQDNKLHFSSSIFSFFP